MSKKASKHVINRPVRPQFDVSYSFILKFLQKKGKIETFLIDSQPRYVLKILVLSQPTRSYKKGSSI